MARREYMRKNNRKSKRDKIREGVNRDEVQKNKWSEKRRKEVPTLLPKNNNQKKAMNAFDNNQLIVLNGSAGTGKTTLACWEATKLWMKGEVDTIIITRPNKSLGKDPGAVPGGDGEKVLLYTMSMLMKFKQYLGPGALKSCLSLNLTDLLFKEVSGIAILPLEKIQGLSFDSKTIIIADEIQSSTVAQVKSLTTRMEEGAKLLICGDPTQSAMKGAENGLSFLLNVLENNEIDGAEVINFKPEDNCRKGISAQLTAIYETQGVW